MATPDLAELRNRVLDVLRILQTAIGGAWPLTEAFTDLDDHREDDDADFNYNVGYAAGLCEAAGLDLLALCAEVEPVPPVAEEFFDDPNGAICPHCEERSDDPNHAANCGPLDETEVT